MNRQHVCWACAIVVMLPAALGFFSVCMPAWAGNLYWDSNGATPGAGTTPTGTWGTNSFWSTDSTGALATGPYVANSDVFFSAGIDATGTFTVTLSGTQAANSLTFEEGAATISGGTGLTLAGAGGNITVNPGLSASIGSVVGGTVGLAKVGTGTLTLSGANTYTGGTTASGGVLRVGSDGNLGGAGVANYITLDGGTLQPSASFALNANHKLVVGASGGTINGNGFGFTGMGADLLQGSGTLTITGSSSTNTVLQFSGAQNNFTGAININSGRINLNGAGATLGTGDITVGAGSASLYLSSAVTLANKISIQSNGGESRGAVRFQGGGTVNGDIVLLANAGLSSETAATPVTLNGNISGNFQLQLGGLTGSNVGATYILTGTNSHNTTLLGNGTLTVANTAALGAAGRGVTLNGGTLALATDSAVSSKNVTMGGNATIVLDRDTAGAAFNTTFGTFTSTSGDRTLTVTAGPNVTSGTPSLTFNSTWSNNGRTTTFNVGAGAEVIMSGAMPAGAQNASVVKSGAGRLVLGGNYGTWDDGGITLNAGTLELRSIAGDTGDFRNITAAANTTLELAKDAALDFRSGLTANGSLTLVTDRTASGAGVTHTLGTLTVGGNHTLTVNAGNNTTSGTAGLTFGATTLNGDATFIVNDGATAGTRLTLASVTGAARDLTIDGTGDATISGVIGTTSGALTKNGPGQLILSGANTYSGGTTINQGRVQAGHGSAFGTGPVSVLDGGQIWLSAASKVTVSNPLTLAGNGWSEPSGYLGAIRFSGTVNPEISGPVTLADDTRITAWFATDVGTISGDISGGFALEKTGLGTVTLSGANSYTGTTTVTAGTLEATAPSALPGYDAPGRVTANTGSVLVVQVTPTGGWSNADIDILLTNATFNTGSRLGIDVAGSDTFTRGTALGGSVKGLGKLGSGTLILGANNTYGEGTIVGEGRLRGDVPSAFGTGPVTVQDGAQVWIYGAGTWANDFDITGLGWTEAAGQLGAIRMSRGDITGNVTLLGDSRIALYGAGESASISGTISDGGGAYSLQKTGAGTLALGGANSYTGGTTIGGGTLEISAANNLGSPSGAVLVDFTGNGTLHVTASFATSKEFTAIGGSRSMTFDIDGGVTLTANGDVRNYGGAGTVVKNGAGTLVLTAPNEQWDKDLNLNAGTVELRNAQALGNSDQDIWAASGATLELANNTATDFNGSFQVNGNNVNLVVDRTGAGAGVTHRLNYLTFRGSYALNVSAGSNTTSGTAGVTFDNSTTLNGDATFNVIDPGAAGILLTLGGVTGTNRNLTIQGSGNTTIGGAITTGAGTLTKNGSGQLILSGANAYSGGTTINQGRVQANHSSAFGSGPVNVQDGGQIWLNAASKATVSNPLTLAGNGWSEPSGYLGAIRFSGTVNHEISGPVTLADDTRITAWEATAVGTISGDISGGFALEKTGPGTITLSGANTYTGGTTISDGTLRIADDSALGAVPGSFDAANVTLDGGGILKNNAGSVMLAANRGITLGSSGGEIDVRSATTITVPGAISGPGSLTKADTGTLTLTGASSYTGGTTINAGTLQLSGGNDRLPTGTTVAFAGSSKLDVTSVSQSVSALTFADGASSTITGGGTLAVNGPYDLNIGPAGVASSVTLNMSGLGNFVYNVPSKTFRVGLAPGTSGRATGQVATATLGDTNTITATNLNVADVTASSDGGSATLHLGGSNTLNVNAINVGASGRSDATMDFAAGLASPSVTVRNTDGISAVSSWNIGRVNNYEAGTWNDTVDLSAGTVDALVTNMTIGSASDRWGTVNGTFEMAAGNLNVTGTLTIGQAAGATNATTRVGNGKFNLLGGTVRANTLRLSYNTATGGTATANGTFNLKGGTLAVGSLIQGSDPATFNFLGGTLAADSVGMSLTNSGGALAPGGRGTIGTTTFTSGNSYTMAAAIANWALASQGAEAWQSSNYNTTYLAGLAIDGNTSTSNFSHTAVSDDLQRWQVDLKGSRPIEKITIYNRYTDGNRLTSDNGFTAEVLRGGSVVWTQDFVGGYTHPMTITLPGGAQGDLVRFTKIQPLVSDGNRTFNLSEVQVFSPLLQPSLDMDIDAATGDCDKLIVGGALTLDGVLNVNLLGGELQENMVFDLMDWGSISGTFDQINLPFQIAWDTSSLYVTGEIRAIPEPATMALLGLAVTGLGGYIRRRRAA